MAGSFETRVWTVPNAITVARLALLVPVCLLVLQGAEGSWWPPVLLALWASTDWIDGVLARALGQTSRLGEILDPIADRVGIVGVTLSLAIVGVVDWWVLAAIAATDVATVALAGAAARDGGIRVSWLGKWRTAVLLTAVVVLVLGETVWPAATLGGLVLLLVGTGLHVLAGVDYIRKARAGTGGSRRRTGEARRGPDGGRVDAAPADAAGATDAEGAR